MPNIRQGEDSLMSFTIFRRHNRDNCASTNRYDRTEVIVRKVGPYEKSGNGELILRGASH
jgi:hypothetical protein